ncbi:flagellar basal body P-ring protein FlgI [Methylophaga sp. OBS4]|uniref:flagellar basal body P-ring protein FlgI n=1 Tax=Methylophaga sp. OBS4 TaxID=2991935 RepID=UPI0022500F3B|nr:flagellar basal body P-ring protein FlgI [Methylophaga sp. OBS4]MCX4187358.1 flagellar basal body P-ring protein FlgI [Methylophaga sp. OBS4]
MKIRILLLALLLMTTGLAQAERIKDLASIAGVRSNQLVGYGLVVGLNGTGDKTKFTGQTLRNMLVEMGINIPPGTDPKSKNVAAVSVHAELPAFIKPGQTIDVTVSSLGDAKSLRGGSLLMTPLKGADGQVYAMAQGNMVVGGFGADAGDGSRVTVNIPSAGRVPNGATVERTVQNAFNVGDSIILNLHNPDFTTASRLSDAINHTLGKGTARSMDGSSIKVNAPRDPSQRVPFLSLIENLELNPGEAPARVVVNSRSGTVVIGQHVRVSPAAVTHGNLSVTISANPEVSQPNPLSQGQTVITPNFDIEITEENSRMFVFNPGVSLDEIVRAVNQVGAAPGDLVAILEALKQAGALRADLVVI